MNRNGDRVTLKDVYDAVNNLETKIDRRLERSEMRIDSLEAGQNRSMGILAILSVFLSAGASYVWDRVLGR